ncbi:membrane-bound acid phosphatase 2 [Trypanosoma conorhini]|uniref:Membrane-bound acid phosphatase 2 n=1 Tax=Trypanosoma conorhini TaxID=83891 RepID=A0A3R7MCS8_9TRYP|nr:membrane-bound acid phosphatase 2 [Trypanosoma conorhini]RNF03471.1 membrane-bound acid phosphatase 2 [Trypanosoma conorhini]
MGSDGRVYVAKDNTCPYYDLQRFVESSKPTSPEGLCYLSDHYRDLLSCPAQAGATPNKHCRDYRLACPAFACGSGHTLDPVAVQCVCSSASCMERSAVGGQGASEKRVSAGATAGIAIACFAVGAILVACVAVVVAVSRRNVSNVLVEEL